MRLLLLEFDDLDREAGHGVVEMCSHALNRAFDGDDLFRMIDGVGGLGIVSTERNELCGRGDFGALKIDVDGLGRGCAVDELHVDAFFRSAAGDGIKELRSGAFEF